MERGLYGTILVEPTDPSYWPAVDRQLTLTLDDLLVEDGHIAPFHFAVRGARAKLVGGDIGRYERETFVEEVLLVPSERAVLDVLFDTPRDVRLEHRTPKHVYDLGGFSVTGTATGNAAQSFDVLRTRPRPHRRASVDQSRPGAAAGQNACVLLAHAAAVWGR